MPKTSTLRGVCLRLGSVAVFCVMSGLIRQAEGIDTYKITLFRFVIGLGLLGGAALFGKIKLEFRHAPFLFLRGLFGGAAVFLLFLSIARLGVGRGTVIFQSFPIFASLLGALLLRERIGPAKWVAILGAFYGIYLLTVEGGKSVFAFGLYELLALLGAVLAGLAVVLVKKLHETDSTHAIFFSQCLVGMWLMLIPANLVSCSIGVSGGLMLLAIGLCASAGQLLMTESYRHLNVTTASLLSMGLPVLNFLIGICLFHEPVTWRAAIGAVIVIVACIAVIVLPAGTAGSDRPGSDKQGSIE